LLYTELPVTPITRFNILATALAGLILALSISYFFIFLPYKEYSERKSTLRQRYIAEEKQDIKLEAQRAIDELQFLYRDYLNEIQTQLQVNVVGMKTFIEARQHESLSQIHSRVTQLRRELNQLPLMAHLIFDAQGELISCCNKQYLRELGMASDLNSAEIEALTQPLREEPQNKRVLIHWPSATDGSTLEVHALRSEAQYNGWQVVAMLPQQISDVHLQKRFLERLSHVRFGQDASGYFYILNAEAKPLMISIFSPPFNKDLVPLDIPDNIQQIAQRLVQTSANGGGYIDYSFENPASEHIIENKIAYVAPLPYWDWTLGTGFYTSILDNRIQAQSEDMLAATHQRARIGVIVVLINLLLGFLIAYVTNRHVRRIETKREEHLKQLQQYSNILDELCLVSKGDLEGNITYANDKFCEVSGYTREEMLGQPHSIVRHPSVSKSVFKRMWQRIEAGKKWRGISRNRTKDGDSYYADSVIMPLTDQDGNIVEYIAARYEITELLEKRDEVKLAFTTDKLTSLGSRHKLVLDISSGSEGMCLLLFDIVDFGGINHNLGTEAADQALLHFSNQLVEFFAAEGSTLYRLHSDLFAVLTESNQTQEIISTVEHFSAFLRRHPFNHAKEGHLNLTVISGVACGEEDLLTCADAALQHAKHNKQAVAIYNPEIANQQGRMRSYWINEVQQALLDQRLIPHYQPIVHILSGRITRYEALMRMQNSQGELISPGAFLPIMEQTSHYPEMTRAIFRQACMFFRYRSESFSVNLSVDDLLRRDTVDSIASMAKSYAVTDRLVLELVETENIHNYDVALKALIELKGLGIKIAIDDFGSGFANFSYLSAFPADFVKIDGSLIKKINEDEKTRNLVKLLIDYAHSEGMEVIAEFVSSVEIFDTISAMGCDYAQGYYFSAPIPGDKITHLKS
jgi:PAS domain S-box-containing protein/diguanylate cyclase (GGDEF)-like protein